MEIFTLKEVLDEIMEFKPQNEVYHELYALIGRIKEKARKKQRKKKMTFIDYEHIVEDIQSVKVDVESDGKETLIHFTRDKCTKKFIITMTREDWDYLCEGVQLELKKESGEE